VTQDGVMEKSKSLYHGHRFTAEVIGCAIRWYFHFQLSLRGFRDLERTQAFLSSVGPIRQHFAIKRHLLRASLYRKQLPQRFDAWHRFTELTQDPSGF